MIRSFCSHFLAFLKCIYLFFSKASLQGNIYGPCLCSIKCLLRRFDAAKIMKEASGAKCLETLTQRVHLQNDGHWMSASVAFAGGWVVRASWGVCVCVFTVHFLLSLLWYELNVIQDRCLVKHRPWMWLWNMCKVIPQPQPLHSHIRLWFGSGKGFSSCIPPRATSWPLSRRIRPGSLGYTKAIFVCIFPPGNAVRSRVCAELLLCATALAGASKWIIHARFEYMQMVRSPLSWHTSRLPMATAPSRSISPPPPHPPPASLRHPPSDHVIHPVVLFRLLLYQAGWLHMVGWQDIP